MDLYGEASCAENPRTVQLVDGAAEAGGARLAEELTVGTGPVVIEARARATLGASELPATGWAVVAYLAEAGDWLDPTEGGVGVAYSRQGYALEWRFFEEDPTDENDHLRLRILDGDGVPGEPECQMICTGEPRPMLDAISEAPLEQGLRLVILPDLPETEANDMAVSAELLSASGPEWAGMACYDDDCALSIQPGDLLQVGLTASTMGSYDASVEVVGLSARASGVCP
jgi:hypothetical protein